MYTLLFFYKEITLADLYHVPFGSVVSQMGSDLLESETRPNVKR